MKYISILSFFKKNIILICIILIFIIILLANIYNLFNTNTVNEGFNNNNNIDYYVITLKHQDRMNNIQIQNQKIPDVHIGIVDAILGDNVDMNALVKSNKVDNNFLNEPSNRSENRHREIGCFLSHNKVHDLIFQKLKLSNQSISKYSVVFEDDFELTDDFKEKINEALSVVDNIDFDLLYLGNLFGAKGKHINKNVYHDNKDHQLYGTHGYLINNKNIQKIIENTQYIDRPIDVLIDELSNAEILKVYLIDPTIVNQAGSKLPSSILI